MLHAAHAQLAALKAATRRFAAHPLGDDLLVLDSVSRTAHVLTPDLAYVWRSVEAGIDFEQMRDEVADALGGTADAAAVRCSELISKLVQEVLQPRRTVGLFQNDQVRISLPPAAASVTLSLLGVPVRFVFSDQADALQVRMHLSALLAADNADATRCTVLRIGSRLLLSEPETGVLEVICPERLPAIAYTIVHRVYAKLGSYSVALHAAAVELSGRAIIIAGRSGLGKSTLAAALCARGARLLSEDTLLVSKDGKTFLVSSPFVRIRRFVRKYVAAMHPSLERLPELAGKDGLPFSFLPLPPADNTGTTHPLVVVLGSRAEPGAALKAEAVADPGAVLRLLMGTGCLLSQQSSLDESAKALQSLAFSPGCFFSSWNFDSAIELLLSSMRA